MLGNVSKIDGKNNSGHKGLKKNNCVPWQETNLFTDQIHFNEVIF